jgi:subtilisin family serine protease
MKSVILVLFLFLPAITEAQCHKHCRTQIRVAVVDTGLDLTDPRFKNHLCPTGHKNFVEGETLDDVNGHGTFIAGLIEKYAGNANYCLLIYKYYQESAEGVQNLNNEVLAFKEAIANKADIINFSAGGPEFYEKEALMISENPRVTFVVAAGNEGKDLDIPGNEYYPASLFYTNMKVVENTDKYGVLSEHSNYSKKIKDKEVGVNVLSYLPDDSKLSKKVKTDVPYTKTGYMSGTSMSTAIFSGKLVDKLSKTCEYSK